MMELRGPNGSGKSSLLRLLAGLNRPSAGRVNLESENSDVTLAEQAHFIGHADAIKPSLTVTQNLEFWAAFLSGRKQELPLDDFGLRRLKDDPAMLLSAGQKRRLALTRLLVTKRMVWLLDEPSVGLDATSLAALQKVISRHRGEGGMVIAATHIDLELKATQTLHMAEAR